MLLSFIILICFTSHSLGVPDAASIGMKWEYCPLRQMPVVQNFIGAVTLRQDIKPGYGFGSLGPLTLVPFLGNFQNTTITVDGEPLILNETGWYGCEAFRSAFSKSGSTVGINNVRMPFSEWGIFQSWTLSHPFSSPGEQHEVNMNLDGPYFRKCGQPHNPCGWGLSLPVDRDHFSLQIVYIKDFVIMLVTDRLTSAGMAASLWIEGGAGNVLITVNPTNNTFDAEILYSQPEVVLKWAATVNQTADLAMKWLLATYLGDNQFDLSYNASCPLYNKKFASAFDTEFKTNFPGNLPTLESNSPEIDHLYYWAAHALLSLSRTSYPTYPRQYVISEGPSNSLDGSLDMGGSGQYLWDLSFASISYTLLDPLFTKSLIIFLISNSDLQSTPINIPQSWDAYSTGAPGDGTYRFDYYSAYLLIVTYISYTNNTDFLLEIIQNNIHSGTSTRVIDYLRILVWVWKSFPISAVSEYLVDYGADKRLYLEAVPTYHSVVPALQLGNAGMLFNLARLLKKTEKIIKSDPTEIRIMENNAMLILDAVVKHQFVFDTANSKGGYWKCIYEDGKAQGVRSIADFMYSGQSIEFLAKKTFPDSVKSQSLDYFLREILADGWVRAISLSDPTMGNVFSMKPNVEDLVSMRPDWTGTGGYGGVAGFAADTVADLSPLETLETYVAVLRNLSYVSYNTMPAQGIAVMTPPFIAKFLNNNDGRPIPKGPYGPAWPEFFDVNYFPPWWPNTERTIQNAEASLCDSIVRTLFGWRPDFLIGKDATPEKAITDAIYRPNATRGDFNGRLRNVWTPFGYIDLISNSNGVTWAYS